MYICICFDENYSIQLWWLYCICFTDEMDEMGWYDEVVMVYVIGFINSRLLGFCYCCFVCFVFVCILFVVGCFDFVIVVMFMV